ncbi:hypothetical protein VitviT2T_028829 [Vitis vinifera]|uniref:EGF-like domain-containing protein n=1 Tax=Vitis vinifera TaxID=29760 RepID=A0ABY9DWI1_VITVI|nr:hypothetical protein VitviT2T_028829 [Vitis vinifera]
MKDLGEVDTILGIKVKRNSGGYALNQTHYIEKVVSKFCHLKIKDANTPFDSSIKLEKNDGRSVAQLEYASAIGSLMYAAQCTRADISFAVSKLSRFISNPSVEHWKAIGRVLGYLKNTKELSLQYSKFPIIIEGYSDASWISSVRDNLSTTGWVFTLGGGVVSWGSKKQTCISHSTMEAEFIALAATGKEVEWLKDLMMDIPFTANNVSTVSIHCDSQATLARAYSGVYNGKSRHISIRHEVKLKVFNEIQSMYDKHLKGLLLASAATVNGQAKEGCLDRCEAVIIPYPFGTDEHCYLSPYFWVTSNHSSNPPKLLLGKPSPEGNNVQVLDISLEGELLILNYVSHDCYDSLGEADSLYSYDSYLKPGQFNISSTKNKFTMVGCDTFAWFKGQRGHESYRTGCMSICDNITDVQNGSCSRNGCCQTSIPDGLSAIDLTLGSFNNYSEIWEFNPCGYAFIVEESNFNFSSNDLRDLKSKTELPMVFDWALDKETCQVDVNDQTNNACKGNSTCNKRITGWGYLCNCSEGYQGNPYLEPGCQDIIECENSILNKCENPETCINTQGNYTCSCPMWYHGDGKIDGQRCIPNRLQMIHVAMVSYRFSLHTSNALEAPNA